MTSSHTTKTLSGFPRAPRTSGVRSDGKRASIVDAAMRRFAQEGFDRTRVDDIAADLHISKSSVFQHFGEKRALFLATYEAAMRLLPRYLDAPAEVRQGGFFATIEYWLERREHLVGEHWMPYRVVLIGHYCTDFDLRREINRFVAREDPYGTAEFVRFGLETGELRPDVDVELIASLVDWLVDRVLDALVAAELDPGLFWRRGSPEHPTTIQVEQFMQLLRRAIGADATTGPLPDGDLTGPPI